MTRLLAAAASAAWRDAALRSSRGRRCSWAHKAAHRARSGGGGGRVKGAPVLRVQTPLLFAAAAARRRRLALKRCHVTLRFHRQLLRKPAAAPLSPRGSHFTPCSSRRCDSVALTELLGTNIRHGVSARPAAWRNHAPTARTARAQSVSAGASVVAKPYLHGCSAVVIARVD